MQFAATVTGAADGPEKTTLWLSAKATKSSAIWPATPVREMCSLREARRGAARRVSAGA